MPSPKGFRPMPRARWFARLTDSPVRQTPKRRRAARPGLLRLEDRAVPAFLSAAGTTLNVRLDAAGERLDVAAAAAGLRLGASESVGGLGTAGEPVTVGSAYTAVVVTDAADSTSVVFGDSGADAYGLAVELDLGHGSAGVTFDGLSDFGDHGLTVSADSGITVMPGAVVRAGAAAI